MIQVDDKYQYSCDNKDNYVHGWISSHPHIGFWVITPSDEFRGGGPMKTDLTSHVGPVSLAVRTMHSISMSTSRISNNIYILNIFVYLYADADFL